MLCVIRDISTDFTKPQSGRYIRSVNANATNWTPFISDARKFSTEGDATVYAEACGLKWDTYNLHPITATQMAEVETVARLAWEGRERG